MTRYSGVIGAPQRDVQVNVGFSIFLGNIAREVADLHLLGERLIHVFFGSGIKERNTASFTAPIPCTVPALISCSFANAATACTISAWLLILTAIELPNCL